MALAGPAMVRMASTGGHKVMAIGNTRLDQLFAPQSERLAVLAVSQAGAVGGTDSGTPATGPGGAPTGATPPSPLTPAAVDEGTRTVLDRRAHQDREKRRTNVHYDGSTKQRIFRNNKHSCPESAAKAIQ